MKLSNENRTTLEIISRELKENLLCLNLIEDEMLNTRRNQRNTKKYDMLVSLINRFTDFIQTNTDL